MRRRREHGLEASGHRHAAIEATELGRDLSLVVVHREHAVEFAAEGLEEHGVRGIRPFARDAALRRFCDGRRDDLDLLPSEQAALACVRIQRRHGNARRSEPRSAHGCIGERKGRVDARGGDLLERHTKRHVRSHARHPQVVEDVHLAEKSLMAREMREQLMLVVEAPTAGVQRGLVQRRKYDAVEPALQRQLDHVRKRFAAHATRLG